MQLRPEGLLSVKTQEPKRVKRSTEAYEQRGRNTGWQQPEWAERPRGTCGVRQSSCQPANLSTSSNCRISFENSSTHSPGCYQAEGDRLDSVQHRELGLQVWAQWPFHCLRMCQAPISSGAFAILAVWNALSSANHIHSFP